MVTNQFGRKLALLSYGFAGIFVALSLQPVAHAGTMNDVIRSFLPKRLGGVKGDWGELSQKEYPDFYKNHSEAFKNRQITKVFFNHQYNVGFLVDFDFPRKPDEGSGYCLSHASSTFYVMNEKGEDEFLLPGGTLSLVSNDPEKLSKECAFSKEYGFEGYILVHEYIPENLLVKVLGDNQAYLKSCEHLVSKGDVIKAQLSQITGNRYSREVDYVLFYDSDHGSLKVNMELSESSLSPIDCSRVYD